MPTGRLEVRLDDEYQQKLADIVEARHEPVSALIREMIDEAHEKVMLEERLAAVAHMASLEIEDVPDPDELSRQLAKTYEMTNLPDDE